MSPIPERLAGWLAVRLQPSGSQGLATDCCWRCQRRLFASTSEAKSASNSRWKARQKNDHYTHEAKAKGLKSRAAFKLLEMDAKYKLFRSGQMVVDLGYAPGSWSQVAMERIKPEGRVLGIDLIPAQPPRGVSTIQGNFLSPTVRTLVKEFLISTAAERRAARIQARLDERANAQQAKQAKQAAAQQSEQAAVEQAGGAMAQQTEQAVAQQTEQAAAQQIEQTRKEKATDVVADNLSYLEMELQQMAMEEAAATTDHADTAQATVDIVLSDMLAPTPQTYGFHVKTLKRSYDRLKNTSGVPFHDHAASMDLCNAALEFASETLRTGGHFVCKFYQGREDKALEMRLRNMFAKVHREKPRASRSESNEVYLVALRRKKNVTWQDLVDSEEPAEEQHLQR